LRLWRRAEADAEGGERFYVHGGHVTAPTALADILDLIDERRFRLLGRSNDLIHVAGKRSSLAHLNHHLNRVPGVLDGAFWLPDEVADGVVRTVAFVVAPGLTAADIVAALRQRLEAAFVPRRVVLLDRLPREATGKITTAALRALAAAHLFEHLAGHRADAPREDAPPAFDIPADHPAFAGHFPGQPVLPGVALLTLVWQALAAQPALRALVGDAPGIDHVKFLAPVRPGARVDVRLSRQARGVGFDLHDGDGRCVARGRLAPSD
jgi:hypothetical protein